MNVIQPKALFLLPLVLLVLAMPLFAQTEKVYTVDDALYDLRVWYENARESGATASAEMYEWLKTGIEKMNTWEYHVIGIPNAEIHTMSTRMNELGQERWECISVQQVDDKMVLFFKRPGNYNLSALPIRELLRALSVGRALGSH